MINLLPKMIINELRLTCALKEYSRVKKGKSIRLAYQHLCVGVWYHGEAPNHPLQIKLLADTYVNYIDLYDEVQVTAKKKKMEWSL